MGNDWFHEYFINELKAIGRKPTSNMQHEVVDSLPSSGNEQTIYFVKNDSSLSNNHYDEYVWISSSSTFEKIGSSQIDGSAANPDWNQNDDTQPDYIKNRPFYTGDSVETVVVEERTVAFNDPGFGVYVAEFETTFVPTVGETYKVSWDGTVYECACINFNDATVIGNLSITGEGADSGEPFAIGMITVGQIQIITQNTSASHTISISERTIQVVKIDPKYIRDMYYTADSVETVLVEERTVAFADTGQGFYEAEFKTTFVPTVGETYTVSWDGTVYECACVGAGNNKIIGNLSITGDGSDTGEPFVMGGFKGRGAGIYTADTTSSYHTISISGRTTQVVKIDEKYLPDTVATKSDVEDVQFTAYNAVSYSFNQQLTDAQKQQARTNIGAGTSNFSGNWSDLTGKPIRPTGESYLTFSSPNNFTLSVKSTTKPWDGTLEYFASNGTWTTWDGKSALSAIDYYSEYVLYLRGIGNTFISRGLNFKWILTGADIKCIGNIENLLNYATVKSGVHPSIANNCFQYMFSGCTSLIQAPTLPATTLTNYCYSNMFQGCTSLTKAPALPATTLANYCYSNMFNGCTSLIQAPALPATTLKNYCYSNMFNGCTSLIQAPTLPATTLASDCYSSMFNGCTSLTKAPTLPATTLADHCYYYMLQGCISLTKIPVLPATTLADHCYTNMFQGCTGLKLSTTPTNEYTQEYRIPFSGNGTTATAALHNMFISTGGTFAGEPSINTTYYLSTDNMIVRETEIATLNGYVDSMIDTALSKIGIAEEGTY